MKRFKRDIPTRKVNGVLYLCCEGGETFLRRESGAIIPYSEIANDAVIDFNSKTGKVTKIGPWKEHTMRFAKSTKKVSVERTVYTATLAQLDLVKLCFPMYSKNWKGISVAVRCHDVRPAITKSGAITSLSKVEMICSFWEDGFRFTLSANFGELLLPEYAPSQTKPYVFESGVLHVGENPKLIGTWIETTVEQLSKPDKTRFEELRTDEEEDED